MTEISTQTLAILLSVAALVLASVVHFYISMMTRRDTSKLELDVETKNWIERTRFEYFKKPFRTGDEGSAKPRLEPKR